MEAGVGWLWDELTDIPRSFGLLTKGTLVMARIVLAIIAAVALAGCAN